MVAESWRTSQPPALSWTYMGTSFPHTTDIHIWELLTCCRGYTPLLIQPRLADCPLRCRGPGSGRSLDQTSATVVTEEQDSDEDEDEQQRQEDEEEDDEFEEEGEGTVLEFTLDATGR